MKTILIFNDYFDTKRALIERPYRCGPQTVGAVYDRPVRSHFSMLYNGLSGMAIARHM
jgi:hypothetical protein